MKVGDRAGIVLGHGLVNNASHLESLLEMGRSEGAGGPKAPHPDASPLADAPTEGATL